MRCARIGLQTSLQKKRYKKNVTKLIVYEKMHPFNHFHNNLITENEQPSMLRLCVKILVWRVTDHNELIKQVTNLGNILSFKNKKRKNTSPANCFNGFLLFLLLESYIVSLIT